MFIKSELTKRFKIVGVASVLTLGLTACASNDKKVADVPAPESKTEQMASTEATKMTVSELYEVHDDGRIYVFYDRSLYEDFLKTGHTAYMLARIGAGPKSETIKFALTGEDKKKRSGIPSVELFDGNADAASPFYAEMRSEGRIYVFDNADDLTSVRKVGEAPYRFTEIGAGPNGETIVYVLNKSNKKQKPVALIEAFKKQNGMS